MTVISFPTVNASIIPADVTVQNSPHKVLLVGQKLSAGTATAGALVENIGNDGSENTLFGKASMLAEMVRQFKKINNVSRVDAIALDDVSGGTAATGTVVFTGTATASGTILVSIGSSLNYTFSVPVVSGNTPTVLATALAALITANTAIPYTAASSTGTVTLTARHKGTLGNDTSINVTGSAAGVTMSTTAFTGGATDPTLTGVFAVCGDERYQTIVWPYHGSISTVTTNFLDGRYNVNNAIKDGVAITSKADTYANHITGLNALNTQNLLYICNRSIGVTTQRGSSMVEFDYGVSAQFAAIRSLRLTEGANIARYVVGNGSRDRFGGVHIAGKPYANTPMPFLPLVPIGLGFTDIELAALNTAGGTVIGVNRTRTSALIGQAVTTYKTDVAGNPDPTYKYLNNVDVAVATREFFFNNIKADFAQHRLTDGDLIPNIAITNKEDIKATFISYYADLAGPAYSLLRAGEDVLQAFKSSIDITLNLTVGSITAYMIMPIIVQARTFNIVQQIAFDLNN
jgi:phage tail sheath gpL-like